MIEAPETPPEMGAFLLFQVLCKGKISNKDQNWMSMD